MRRFILAFFFAPILFLPNSPVHAAAPGTENAALPAAAQKNLPISAEKTSPAAVLQEFLGIPYRNDGALNDAQEFATFNAPNTVFSTPGLNCSGMVLAASRRILNKNIPLKDAVRDRLGDSGPNSPAGHDWDFGFDFIMNIAEEADHELLLPPGVSMPESLTGKNAPGFDPHAPSFTDALLPRIKENRFYLLSFSKRNTPDSLARIHYHTGILVREGEAVWAYGTTRNSRRVIRVNIASPEGLVTFRRSFRNADGSYKRLTVIEVTPE